MTNSIKWIVCILLICFGLPSLSALGEEPRMVGVRPDVTKLLYAGDLERGEEIAKEYLSDHPEDEEVRFGLGIIQYSRANERLAQAMFSYAASKYEVGLFVESSIATNPNPLPVEYVDCLRVFQAYVDDLQVADDTFKKVVNKRVQLQVDDKKVHYDCDGSGTVDGNDHTYARSTYSSAQDEETDHILYYVHVLLYRYKCKINSANLNGVFKYDLQRYFDLASFQSFKHPKPRVNRLIGPQRVETKDPIRGLIRDGGTLDNFPVIEKERAEKSLKLTLEAIELRRQIDRLRTIDSEDFRMMPIGKQQKKALKEFLLTDEQAAFRLKQSDDLEQLLLGQKLLPHPKLEGRCGINVRRTYLENTEYDYALIGTGDYWGEFVEEGECVDVASMKNIETKLLQQIVGYGSPLYQ